MRLSINTLNAAFIINDVIMSGGGLGDAVIIARNEPLLNKGAACLIRGLIMSAVVAIGGARSRPFSRSWSRVWSAAGGES